MFNGRLKTNIPSRLTDLSCILNTEVDCAVVYIEELERHYEIMYNALISLDACKNNGRDRCEVCSNLIKDTLKKVSPEEKAKTQEG